MSLGLPTPAALAGFSPSQIVACPQDRLEQILLDPQLDLGAKVGFGHRFRGIDLPAADHEAVRITIETGQGLATVTARYLVGADGARSDVRAVAGIDLVALGSEGDHLSILFRADLSGLVPDPPPALTRTVAPGVEGMLVATGEAGRWMYDVEWHPERGDSLADWSDQHMIDRLRALTGRPSLQPEVLGLFPWDFGASVAARQRAGRVFLVGDAAHRTTPRGATGMNTGMADGHNLGWKLAWAARGLAGEALIDSYEQERGPVGRANAEASLVTAVGTGPVRARARFRSGLLLSGCSPVPARSSVSAHPTRGYAWAGRPCRPSTCSTRGSP